MAWRSRATAHVVVRGRNAGQNIAPLPDLNLTTPTLVAGLTEVRSVAAGGSSTGDASSFALRGDGTVWSWGHNNGGVLGHGSGVARRTTPQPIPGLTRVVRLVVAGATAYALRDDGTVWVWGAGSVGQLGLGDTRGSQPTPIQVPGLANIVSIDAQERLAYALRSDGALFGWGQGYGNVTIGAYEWPSAGGRRLAPTLIPSTPIANVVGVAGAESGVYVFSGSDRALQAWGINANGKLGVGVFNPIRTPTAVPTPQVNGVPQTWRNVRGCSLFSVGWTETGLVYAWGTNNQNAPYLGDPALTEQRTATPNRVPGLDQVAEATCGMGGSAWIAVRRNNGELWTWGSNNGGQLADGNSGSLTARYTPMMVFNLDN